MNFGIFLIIFGFTETLFSLKVNKTEDDSCHICTISYFRRKRAHSEYTRWYANPESTQEFIVKVLEDDISTARNIFTAVNIQPFTEIQENIIVGGVAIPSPTTELIIDNSNEYTRFVPPTTRSITQVDEKIVQVPIKSLTNLVPPVRPKGIEIKHSSGRHLNRDMNPPESPQFLSRSQTLVARQFAPIAPVSFTRRKTIGPLTPRTVDNFTDVSSKSFEKENELFDNNLFYNDDDDVECTKTQGNVENINVAKVIKNTPESIITSDFTSNITEADVIDKDYLDEDESENVTLNTTAKSIFGVATLPEIAKPNNSTRKRPICSVMRSSPLTFSRPQTLHEIVIQLKHWAEESPVAKWLDITKGNYTVMENPIYMMIVDDPSSGQIISAKKTVMIVAGIQGRDHHAVTAAMYVLYQLIERSEARADLLSKFRFWIIPVFNPDGYDYSITFPHRTEWSKNLRQSWDTCKGRDSCRACEDFGLRCTIQPCYGVNLDRNFEYQWIPPEELRAEHPCGALYAGPRQLSEIETHALTHFLREQQAPIYSFIAFKEGEVLGILYPHSHTNKRRAFDHVHRQRASRAASAAYSISGRPYVAGQTSEFLPLYAGGIEDWVDGHLGIDNTYTVMMFRPNDAQNSKLATERVVHEAYAAVDTLLLQNIESPVLPQVTLTRAKAALSRLPLKRRAILIILIIQRYV
ncbi:uncharacterized protein LOC123657250 [Melitaea cinxia]|uniref:uncharacterized protein LOC123657250 n=1 Tax=Melitaea cinxia TaxID=113334 RepID=UPI001E273A33|nr:uncharacterized protein LOC123657250 [Melitaea cinxia]